VSPERWLKLMRGLGFQDNSETFDALIKRYSESHRFYHTKEHIDACLLYLDKLGADAENLNEVELAIWFHDAVYDPFSSSNEADSATWAKEFLNQNNAPDSLISNVDELIMATLHDAKPYSRDAALLVDIDLSTLGESAGVYDKYEKAVRKEYKRVPYFIYKSKRREILKGFLEKNSIYTTPYFLEHHEDRARENLTRAISNL